MAQSWRHLLFAHWRVPPDALRRVMPPELPLDTFEGEAWLGVTPFEIHANRPYAAPPAPWLSTFPEANVRTYVTIDDKPGIFFFSLDCARLPAVFGARRGYRLPYFHADMSVDVEGDRVRYHSRRTQDDGPPAELDCEYGPDGAVYQAAPGSLDYWLTERYCLYTLDAERRVLRGEIQHPPSPLQPATATFVRNRMGEQIGVELEGEPLLHYSERQDVVFWRLRPA